MNRGTRRPDLSTGEQESSSEQEENDDIIALFDRFPALRRIAMDICRDRGRGGHRPRSRQGRFGRRGHWQATRG